VLYPNSIEFKKPFLESPYLLIDSKTKLALNTVNYYSNQDGFFIRNTLNVFRENEFLEREYKGKISIYSRTKNYYNMYGSSQIKKMGYTKGDYTLKRFNIKNLSIDLADDADASRKLVSAKIFRNIQIGLTILGSGFIITGLATFHSSFENKTNTSDICIATGAGCLLAAIPFGAIRTHKIRKAVNIYSKD